MADIQNHFLEFHNKIKLDNENVNLVEKREIVVSKLKKGIKKLFEENELSPPGIETFSQGSYAMYTGIKSLKDDDYDIDVGVAFKISPDDYSNPVVVKQWVYEALKGHTSDVSIKEPCVRVQYKKENKPIYHVDLAIYSDEYGDYHLARGKVYSAEENQVWEVAEPKKFLDLIKNRYSDAEDRSQFRRIIRYLKRWKDIHFRSIGNEAPVGIGITVSAYTYFEPICDFSSGSYKRNDLTALLNFVESILNHFEYFSDGYYRLSALLPVKPWCDVYKKMSDNQMTNFKEKLENLVSHLKEAQDEVDPHEACKKLSKVFGDDFPIPERAETAQVRQRAFITTSESA